MLGPSTISSCMPPSSDRNTLPSPIPPLERAVLRWEGVGVAAGAAGIWKKNSAPAASRAGAGRPLTLVGE